MTSRDFCYWLQGYFELTGTSQAGTLTPAQVDCIRAHLAMVFVHEIDPSMGGKEHQAKLDAAHGKPEPDKSYVLGHGGGGHGGVVYRPK